MTTNERIGLAVLLIMIILGVLYVVSLYYEMEVKKANDAKKEGFKTIPIWKTENTTFGGKLFRYEKTPNGLSYNIRMAWDQNESTYYNDVYGNFTEDLINKEIIINQVDYMLLFCQESWYENGQLIITNQTKLPTCDRNHDSSEYYLVGVSVPQIELENKD